MILTEVIFWIVILLLGAGGLFFVFTRNIIHAAMAFFMVLFTVAALYTFAGAELLAVVQVIIYVGGVLILMLFGIMLTAKYRGVSPSTGVLYAFPAFLTAAGAAVMFSYLYRNIRLPENIIMIMPPEPVRQTGIELLSGHLLPFELISFVLLGAMVGAAYLSDKGGKDD